MASVFSVSSCEKDWSDGNIQKPGNHELLVASWILNKTLLGRRNGTAWLLRCFVFNSIAPTNP